MTLNRFSSLAFTFFITAAHGLAQAGPISFNQSTCHAGAISSSSFTCITKAAGVNYAATMSAWSAPDSKAFGSAAIAYYPYLGVGIIAPGESTNGSQHAVDNKKGTDAFLINFGSSDFALNQVSIGWRDGDADVSILRYTGTGTPLLGNSKVATLNNADGWDWVGDYSTLSANSPLNFNHSGDVKTASWWLVSAYNSAYSGITAAGSLTDANDYFKLNGFGGEVIVTMPPPSNQVPEPGTFALFGIALLGFVAVRRKL